MILLCADDWAIMSSSLVQIGLTISEIPPGIWGPKIRKKRKISDSEANNFTTAEDKAKVTEAKVAQ